MCEGLQIERRQIQPHWEDIQSVLARGIKREYYEQGDMFFPSKN